jgi:hypothetical protein
MRREEGPEGEGVEEPLVVGNGVRGRKERGERRAGRDMESGREQTREYPEAASRSGPLLGQQQRQLPQSCRRADGGTHDLAPRIHPSHRQSRPTAPRIDADSSHNADERYLRIAVPSALGKVRPERHMGPIRGAGRGTRERGNPAAPAATPCTRRPRQGRVPRGGVSRRV